MKAGETTVWVERQGCAKDKGGRSGQRAENGALGENSVVAVPRPGGTLDSAITQRVISPAPVIRLWVPSLLGLVRAGLLWPLLTLVGVSGWWTDREPWSSRWAARGRGAWTPGVVPSCAIFRWPTRAVSATNP